MAFGPRVGTFAPGPYDSWAGRGGLDPGLAPQKRMSHVKDILIERGSGKIRVALRHRAA